MTAITSRRAVLAGVAAAPALTLPVVGAENPDADLIRMEADLVEIGNRYVEAEAVADNLAKADELHEQGLALALRIAGTPATTLDGMRAKARAVLHWCWADDWDFGSGDATDEKLLLSLVRDLAA